MEINLIAESLKFMVLGMSTVFSFLILMVYVVEIQAKVIAKFFPQKPVIVGLENEVKKSSSKDDKALIAAIYSAIQSYKKSKKSKG
ncbi:MAG: OadG family protein [Sulfurospirillaceae bacterium]|nr:OadG family protein [Sulfurospirillaceae bacterium]